MLNIKDKSRNKILEQFDTNFVLKTSGFPDRWQTWFFDLICTTENANGEDNSIKYIKDFIMKHSLGTCIDHKTCSCGEHLA